MKSDPVLAFSPSERRTTLREAREAGVLSYDKLDRLLIESAVTSTKMRGLLRSLSGVEITASERPDDMLAWREEFDLGPTGGAESDLFNRYADQVRRLPRLDRTQEHVMARRLEFARERLRVALDAANLGLDEDTRQTVLSRGVQCDPVDAARERTTSLPYRDFTDEVLESGAEYNRLRDHFVRRNLYLVIGMSSAYRTYGVPMMDLIQEGNGALIRAVEKYDWRKDVRFQTYGAFWVRQAVERMITANRTMVRVPNYVQQKMRRLRREGKLPRNHKDMDARDVSKHFDTSIEAAFRLMETDRASYSLDVSFRDDEEGSLAASLAAEEVERGMPGIEHEALGRRIDDALKEHLTEQEQVIIAQRYGLNGSKPRTLDQIGESMSVSRERIRQMQVKALDKLSKPALLEDLKDFL